MDKFNKIAIVAEAEDIIRKVDHNMRGKNVYMKMHMSIKTKNHKRTMGIWKVGLKV